ncbi:hypothetical protein ASPCAL12838 [Aspergillus calidoustus]|uniref:Rhodopsin domain-containing protein n=1 Tax=Aspergillus calidoustus TaxID=454130 RepID=A0A0U5CGQ2_ASPCI|nr:hypothetical protein ASPCAL12838 [Aspergillus calidoustus]
MLSDPASNGDSVFDGNRGGIIMAAILATTVPALIAVALRAYVRVFMLHHTDQSDYVMAVALLFTLVGGALSIVSVIHGTGRHTVYVARHDIVDALFYFFLAECFYLWTIGLAKISIGLALLPLSLKALYRRSIRIIIVSMLIYTTARFFTIIFQCTKVKSSWDPSVRSHCYSQEVSEALMYSYSGQLWTAPSGLVSSEV